MIAPVDVLAVLDSLIQGNPTDKPELIERNRAIEEARAAVAELIEVAKRARPFLRDEAEKYEDDGSNEPLETLRDLDAVIARVQGEGHV